MKATNRKLKLRARAGRKPITDAIRTPSGQISRSFDEVNRREEKTAHFLRETVVMARVRHFGCSEAEAVNPLLGSSIGRLLYSKRISQAQFEAGNHHAAQCLLYSVAFLGLPMTVRAQDLFRVKGMSGNDLKGLSASAQRAKDYNMTVTHGALLSMSGDFTQNRMIRELVTRCCIHDEPTEGTENLPPWTDFMVACLKKGLNQLIISQGA